MQPAAVSPPFEPVHWQGTVTQSFPMTSEWYYSQVIYLCGKGWLPLRLEYPKLACCGSCIPKPWLVICDGDTGGREVVSATQDDS